MMSDATQEQVKKEKESKTKSGFRKSLAKMLGKDDYLKAPENQGDVTKSSS